MKIPVTDEMLIAFDKAWFAHGEGPGAARRAGINAALGCVTLATLENAFRMHLLENPKRMGEFLDWLHATIPIMGQGTGCTPSR